ncbi:MAG TPA: thiamine pyrophosphate-dependent dehydrogenase E1 component subunit alpha [Magnetovibrio sp.]
MPFEMNKAFIEKSYETMYLIRRVEEEIIRVYPTDAVKSPVHLSIGQESISVGVCEALQPQDIVFGTYRGHALYLAKGGDLNRFMAELYGKVDGSSRGKGGSMHVVDTSVGMMGTSAIVATSIPNAVGHAFAMKMQGRDVVTVCFFGEGATDEGVFHEALNFASLKKLPILFVCENNSYAIYSHVSERMPHPNLCERAQAYRIPAEKIEGGDFFNVHERTKALVSEIRAGGGPRFIECMTYRWRDHVGPGEDRYLQYRPDPELDEWIANDQVARLSGMISDDVRKKIEADAEVRIAKAMALAEESPFPEDQEIYHHVFS